MPLVILHQAVHVRTATLSPSLMSESFVWPGSWGPHLQNIYILPYLLLIIF